jgi:hypothetical protein
MPWSSKQKKLARAVMHGFKPTGKAKDFSKDFASLVVVESNEKPKKKGKS